MRGAKVIATLLSLVALAAPTAATAATGGVAPPSDDTAPAGPVGQTGGAGYDPNAPVVPPGPPGVARLVGGVAYAPAGAPLAGVRAIRAGHKLQNKPYRYGGGPRAVRDTPHDSSGPGPIPPPG